MRLLVLLLALAACGDQRPPPPRDAAAACIAAIQTVANQDVAGPVREALACERLYRDRTCAAAWRRLTTPRDPAAWVAAIDHLVPVCRAACIRQSGGAPPRGCLAPVDPTDSERLQDLSAIFELDRAMHVMSGLPDEEADLLASRASLLALGVPRGIVVPLSDDPVRPGELLVVVDASGTVRLGGDAIPDAQLPAELARRVGRDQLTIAVLSVAPDVPYDRIVTLMDRLRDAGLENISFKVQDP